VRAAAHRDQSGLLFLSRDEVDSLAGEVRPARFLLELSVAYRAGDHDGGTRHRPVARRRHGDAGDAADHVIEDRAGFAKRLPAPSRSPAAADWSRSASAHATGNGYGYLELGDAVGAEAIA